MTAKGLTLLEVITAAAIVIVLAAITSTVVGSVRLSLHATSCAGNLSRLHRAMMSYSADNVGDITRGGSLATMGLPPDIWHPESFNAEGPPSLLIGRKEDWICPAPKAKSFTYFPHYDYPVGEAEISGSPRYLARMTFRHGTEVPLLSDLNHNDHAKVSKHSPRVPKRVLYISLDGRFTSKIVHRQMHGSWDLEFYEL